MSDEILNSELEELKETATEMGITFHPAIGLEKLKEKIANFSAPEAALDATLNKEAPAVPAAVKIDLSKPERIIETLAQMKARKRREATRLVRVRVSCMNPNKKSWEGEILTVSNSLVGSIKKYIPFNNEEGWHIPYMMLLHLKERQCQIFVKKKGPKGDNVVIAKLIKEFSVELLPDLTEAEIKDLAQRQAMSAGTAA